jgi:hypothetical protein
MPLQIHTTFMLSSKVREGGTALVVESSLGIDGGTAARPSDVPEAVGLGEVPWGEGAVVSHSGIVKPIAAGSRSAKFVLVSERLGEEDLDRKVGK